MTIKETKCCIFSRTSTTQQDIEQQTKVLIEEAKRLGYSENQQILIEYQESGTKLDASTRKGINKLKETIELDKSIDCVICWELTRIARRADVIYNIRDFLIEKKICWIILKPSYMELIDRQGNVTPTMSLMLGIFTSFAESEMMIKRERFIRAKNELKSQGKKASGLVIFGYMKDADKRCIFHPLHSKTIIDIFNYYANKQDASCYETYKYISNKYPEVYQMLPYRKAQHKVHSLLTKEVYWKGNWCYPAIVDEAIAEKVANKLNEAKNHPRYECKRDLLCRGKLYCGHCGRMLSPACGAKDAYFCPTDIEHFIQIKFNVADWLIWEETKEIINLNAVFDNNSKINEIEEQISLKNNEIQQHNNILQSNKEKIEKILDLYIDGKISKEIFDKRNNDIIYDNRIHEKSINKLTSDINELRIVIEESQKDILNLKSVNVDSITSFETRLEYVRKYIDKVIVSKVNNEIFLEFFYKQTIYIVQRGLYKYTYRGGRKKVWRINADGTEDLILNRYDRKKKKIG